jgi:hypothetical protein
MILTDTFIVENAELLIEQRGGKTIRRLRGIFGRCDEKNNNGRVYSKPLLEREVKRISEAMVDRRLLGELDHPTHDAVKLSNVSHLITGLDFNGKELVGECELLDTPAGKVAQALVEGGVRIGISSRGMGTLSEHADGTKHVNEDFKLVTFDLVADPSTRGAFPGITESSLVEEIVRDTLEKAAQEKVFTTMLKDKLRERIEGEGTQSAAWTKASIKDVQKKADKKAEKPTVEEPFKNWEYWYGWNSGKPTLSRSRSYNNAETVTAPAKVAENKFCLLKGIIVEDNNPTSFSVLLKLLKESIVSTKPYTKPKGVLKSLIGKAAQKGGDYLSGKADPGPGGLAGRLLKGKRKWKRGGMVAMHKANLRKQFDARMGKKDDAAPKSKPEPEGKPVKVDAIPGEGTSDFERGPRPKKPKPRSKKRGPVEVEAIPGEGPSGTRDLDEPQKPRKKDDDRPIRGGKRKEVPATTNVDKLMRNTSARRIRGPKTPSGRRALKRRIRKSWAQDKEDLGVFR